MDTFGTLDILVNNIGMAIAGSVVDTAEADFNRILEISLGTVFLASKYAVPVMADKGSGAIVNIGSISGFRGGNYVGYSAAKGGVHALTVDMAYAHGRQGIRVNAVAPGHITTPLLYANQGQTAETEFRQRLANASGLLGTEGNGWDVAWAATFLASDEARWITGVTLPVDSGVMSVTPLMMAGPLRALPDPGH
jgi:NAD(P)-dependent dehydrogenase (short-subunit alcohol dehydrogenase family)